MNKILLSNDIITYLSIESILFILQFIAFFYAIGILKNWDFMATISSQYKLEDKTYLVMILITFTMIVKIIVFPYFIFTIDQLSILVPGAMCAAGVISANIYGEKLLLLKISILFLIGLWIIINNLDLKQKNYPYTKKKFVIYLFVFLLILFEIIFNILYLTNITITDPVLCCSILFNDTKNGYFPFNLSLSNILWLFYILYFLSILSAMIKKKLFHLISSLLFVFIGYFAVVYFFGTYIYELPTHKCPYCMLQKDYLYIGYLVWGALLFGTFFAILPYLLNILIKKEWVIFYKYSIISYTVFVIVCSAYFIRYYLINGVLL